MGKTFGHAGNRRVYDTSSEAMSKASLKEAKRNYNGKVRCHNRGLTHGFLNHSLDFDEFILF